MSLEVREITGKSDRKTFIFLPEKIHRGHKNWVPPIWSDEKKYFDPNKNRAFSYCDTIMLLAWRNSEPVGRIMGIINHRYNEYRQEMTARFGYLEAYEDREVVQALLGQVEGWARSKGMTKIVGPYGFSDQDPEGFLIQGFENRATIATYYNFEWMPRMVEEAGYTKDIDYYVYKIVIPKELPDFYQRIYDRVIKRGDFTIVEFKKRKELKPWIRPILSLMNECYLTGEIYGYAPLDEVEMDELAKRYLPIIDPRLVKVVLKDKEPVAFIVGIPDMTEGIQKARGRLWPFGFIHILRAARRSKQLDLLLGAIKEKYRGMGLDVLMGVRMLQSAWEGGFEIIDTHHEMETNYRVRAEMERMGGVIYKIYRVYQKAL